MPVLEEKRIVIRLPSLRLSSLILIPLIIAASFFFYWYQNIYPFLRLSTAYVEAYSSTIHADSAGRIVEMGPKEGESVRKGQTLFSLDQDHLLAKQWQARSALDGLNAQIEMEKERIGKAMESYVTASSETEIAKQLSLVDEAQAK